MIRFAQALLLFIIALTVKGQANDSMLPTAFPESRYRELWQNSPFNREVVKFVAPTIQSNFGQSLTLEGVVNDDIKGTIAYVKDLTENKSFVVTAKKSDSHPYIIAGSNQNNDPRETKVTISNGAESVSIGFPENSLTKKIQTPEVADSPNRKNQRVVPPGTQNPDPTLRTSNARESASAKNAISEEASAKEEAEMNAETSSTAAPRATKVRKRIILPAP